MSAATRAALLAALLAALPPLATAASPPPSRSGFDDKRVTSDPAYRLVTALRSAGVGHSAAGRAAMAAVAPPTRTSMSSGASSALTWA